MRRKAGDRLNQEVAQIQRDQRRQIGWRYGPAVLVYVAFSSALIFYLARFSGPEAAWMGAGFAGGASLLLLHVSVQSAASSRLESAALAEEWASDEVRKLRKSGWRVVDNIPFKNFDVDHVAVGPGGVVVLETKWSEYEWDGRVDPIRARALQKFDRQVARLETPINSVLRQNGSSAQVCGSVIVACGPGRPLTTTRTPGGTRVVPAQMLGEFLSGLAPALSEVDVADATGALETFLQMRLKQERLVAAQS